MRTDRTTPAASSSYSLLREIANAAAASGTVSRILFIARFLLCSSDGVGQFLAGDAPVLTGTGGGRQGKERVAGGAPASSFPSQVGDGDDLLVAAMAGEWVLAAAPVP